MRLRVALDGMACVLSTVTRIGVRVALPGVRVAWLGWHHLFTWLMCHVWHAYRTLRRPPGSCATRGLYAARSAPCLAHVPHVACTPHAPPPAWRMCHAWPVRRTLRPLPGARATRGMHTAGAATCLEHVPHVARTPHAPPPAWRMCHAWNAHRTLRMCHTWHVLLDPT